MFTIGSNVESLETLLRVMFPGVKILYLDDYITSISFSRETIVKVAGTDWKSLPDKIQRALIGNNKVMLKGSRLRIAISKDTIEAF